MMEDLFIYCKATNEIIRIAEGDGSNLWPEDEEKGYVDYLMYEQYQCDVDMPEVDGGQMMLTEMAVDKYNGDLQNAVEDVLEFAYGTQTDYILLLPVR